MKNHSKKQLPDFKMALLNIAEICPVTKSLGPGQRFVIWVQGCCFNCQNCISPDWVPIKEATLMQPKQLADLILATPGIEGITISGGEPMLQVAALLELLTLIKEHKDLSIICFTGFVLEQLRAKCDSDIDNFLRMIDVLIDGQYIPSLNDNRGWRGSSNQVVHFLSSRHQAEEDIFLGRKRDIEIHLQSNSALMVGIPPRMLKEGLKMIFQDEDLKR